MSANAQTVRLSIGLTVEPYIFTDQDKGFELDIVRTALALEGYSTEFVRAPLKRAGLLLNEKVIDGALTVQPHYPDVAGFHFSEPYIEYQNLVVTLLEAGHEMCTLDALSERQVTAFQNAHVALGDAYADSVARQPDYVELEDQQRQVTLFFLGRTDAIVIDWRIFEYFRQQLKESPTTLPVRFHTLFQPSHYRVAFADADIRDAFNRGLAKLRGTTLYGGLIDAYFPQAQSLQHLLNTAQP